VLGDFLGAARRHLDGPTAWTGTSAPGRDIEEVSSSLLRFITVTGRYVSDIVMVFSEMPDRGRRARRPWPRAAAEAMTMLAGGSQALVAQQLAAEPQSRQAICGAARRLDAAAASLTVGRDLLQTHFSQYQHHRIHRSGWSAVITSPAVTQALLTEITALSRLAAAITSEIPMPTGRSAATADAACSLNLARQWLARADAPVRAAHQREPVSDADLELLRALPAASPPARCLPAGTEPVSDLCDAIITTSERASHAAWTATGLQPGSPAISATSWRKVAAAGTAASAHCHTLLTVLANRTGQHGSADTSGQLKDAAADAWLTRSAWLRSARSLGEVTTDVRWRTSRAAADATDLALLTGRLAYADPHWSLASGPSHPARPAALLAPAPEDVPHVLAAIHHATNALAHLAEANLDQVLAGVRAQRILVPARSLATGPAATDSFLPAPEEFIKSVVGACGAVRTASVRTSRTLGDLAVAVHAPSRVLVTARAAISSRRRTRTARADPAAQAAPESAPGADIASPGAGPGPVMGDLDSSGPFESRLRELGVSSSRFLRHASSVDRVGQEVIVQAAADCLDRRGGLAAGSPIRVPGSDKPTSRLPASGRRRTLPQLHTPPVQPELEAEP
jgi:hypothetical protein